MDTARSTFLAKAELTAAALYQTREVTGDVAIACGGETTRAHSHYLRMGSDYFCTALAEEWVVQEHGLRKLTVTDYPPAVLAVAIGWMYGISIPEAFGELKDLLGLADRLLMEELKEEVEKRLTLLVTKENYRDMCEHAETYRVQALAAACARVIVLEGADDADWGVIDKAPIVTAALARLAVPKKGREDRPAATQTEEEARAELFAAGWPSWRRQVAHYRRFPQADHQN